MYSQKKTDALQKIIDKIVMTFVSSDALCAFATEGWESGELSDGRIILDDGSVFKINKKLLARASRFFRKLFLYGKDQTDFHLKELVSKEAFEQILSWIYTHELSLKEDNLPEVMKTAHYLDCFEVVNQCKEFLMQELCFENVLGFWNFAAIYQIQDVEKKFVDFAVYNYNQVQKTEEFLELTPQNIHTLLERNDIIADEETVFQSLISWIKYEKDSRKRYLPDLLQCVRLGCVRPVFFKKLVRQN